MKKIVLFLLIAVLSLLLFVAVFGFQEVRFFRTKADVSQASFSVDNSYVFISPLRAPANNREKIRLTVFLLDNQGLGVMGKSVVLAIDPKLNIENVQSVTDQTGKAVFDISSSARREYYLDVKVDDKLLNQKAHLSFY